MRSTFGYPEKQMVEMKFLITGSNPVTLVYAPRSVAVKEAPTETNGFDFDRLLPTAAWKKMAELKALRKQEAKATVATTAPKSKAAATFTSTSTRPPASTKASKGQIPVASRSSQRIRDNAKQGRK